MRKTKWKNVTASRCVAVWEILKLVYEQTGRLPKGYTPERLLEAVSEELLDCAQLVLNNDELWSSIPSIIKPTKQDVANAKELLRQLQSSLVKVFRMPGAPTGRQMISSYTAGQKRSGVRRKLRNILKTCH